MRFAVAADQRPWRRACIVPSTARTGGADRERHDHSTDDQSWTIRAVIIGGIAAPFYFVSPGQINAQVPFELKSGPSYQLIVSANGALSTPNPIQLAADAPGIAAFSSGEYASTETAVWYGSGTGRAWGVHRVLCIRDGPTDNPVASGQPSPGSREPCAAYGFPDADAEWNEYSDRISPA